MGVHAVARDLEKQQAPTQDFSHWSVNDLLQACLTTALDKLQRRTVTLDFFTSAVVEDEQLHHPDDRRQVAVEVTGFHPA